MVAMLFHAWQAGYRWNGGSRVSGILGYELLLLPFAIVYGMAWWTVFTRKKWAQPWALAASSVLLFMFSILLTKQPLAEMGCGVLFGVAGILGLIAFARGTSILEIWESSEH
jgi:hypothetical protein